MPPVDLTAILPALKEAVAPFEQAYARAQIIKVSPDTRVRNFAPIADMRLVQMDRLIEAVNAIRRMAGDIK